MSQNPSVEIVVNFETPQSKALFTIDGDQMLGTAEFKTSNFVREITLSRKK